MPSFRFSYTQPMAYSELRDATGRLVGLAVPGETVREFDAAPDHMWTPADDSAEPEPEAEAEPAASENDAGVPAPGAGGDAADPDTDPEAIPD